MRIKPSYTILAFLVLFILTSCRSSIKDYYYNLQDLTTPKYYVYTCKEDSNRTQYWKMSADIENHYLITEAYNSSFEQFEYFKEKYDSTGSRLVEYSMMNADEQIKTTPIDIDVFLWAPEGEFVYSVKYTYNNDQILFQKKRELIGEDKVEIMGEKLDAIKFKGTYRFESEKYKEAMESWQNSFYTKEYGFVKYERHEEKGQTISLELTDVLSEKEWESLKTK